MAKECLFDKRDCQAWKDAGYTESDVYEIFIPELGHKKVGCFMGFEGVAWITIQRR